MAETKCNSLNSKRIEYHLRFLFVQLLPKCFNFFDSVKDYIKTGLDKKVTDPDGGIHYRRLRAQKEKVNTSGKQHQANCCVEWPKEGWSLSLVNLPEFQHCYMFSYLSALKEGQKQRAFKSKREGYAMFKASHVQDVKYNFSSHKEFCFFETKVKAASMMRNKTYRTKVRLKKNTAEVDGAYCNCKAGANGYCKHVGAHTILDFVESGFEEIPPNKSCTEKPQGWHKTRTETSNDTLIHFNDILMIHHDCHADKNNKTEKRTQRKKEKLSYTACRSLVLL